MSESGDWWVTDEDGTNGRGVAPDAFARTGPPHSVEAASLAQFALFFGGGSAFQSGRHAYRLSSRGIDVPT